jgi:hypothetical protein
MNKWTSFPQFGNFLKLIGLKQWSSLLSMTICCIYIPTFLTERIQWGYALCSLLHLSFLRLFTSVYFSTTLFSNIRNLSFSFRMSDQVLHPCTTREKSQLIFNRPERRWEDKSFWTERRKHSSSLICFVFLQKSYETSILNNRNYIFNILR